jgi:hypothetical protein
MPLDPLILAGDGYLDLDHPDEHADRLARACAGALSRCAGYTKRTLEPLTTPAPGLPLWGGTTHDPDATVVQKRAGRRMIRIPDCRDLYYVDVLDGPYTGTIAAEDLELVTWGNAPTGVWLRLPFLPTGRPRVAITGKFGMATLPDDLADSLYAYAATRWYEATNNFTETQVIQTDAGEVIEGPRRLPTIVRGVWEAYRPPRARIGSIGAGRA